MLTLESSFGPTEIRNASVEIQKESLATALSKSQANSSAPEPTKPPEEEINSVDKSNPILSALVQPNNELSISLDAATKKIVVKILNSETKEVIKQFPPGELLSLSESLRKMSGAFLDQRA